MNVQIWDEMIRIIYDCLEIWEKWTPKRNQHKVKGVWIEWIGYNGNSKDGWCNNYYYDTWTMILVNNKNIWFLQSLSTGTAMNSITNQKQSEQFINRNIIVHKSSSYLLPAPLWLANQLSHQFTTDTFIFGLGFDWLNSGVQIWNFNPNSLESLQCYDMIHSYDSHDYVIIIIHIIDVINSWSWRANNEN